MRISEYRNVAKTYLKGRYGEAFIVTALCLFVFITFKAISFVISYLAGNIPFSPIIEATETVICFVVMTPLLTGGFWWFFQTACDEDNKNLLKLYSGFRLNGRAVLLYALMWAKSFFSLFPSAICWTAAYIFFYGRTGLSATYSLFASFQCIMLGIAFLGLYFSTFASMALAPFIFISHPDRNPFGVLRKSAKLMKGRKSKFLKLLFSFVPVMLLVVTIPFVMPRVAMSAAIFAKENMTERKEILN